MLPCHWRGALSFSVRSGLTVSGEALAAVDGTVALGDEGNGRGRAAGGTGRLIHLAGSGSAVRLAGRTAFLATGGLVLEALLGVEGLFTGGKHKFLAAIPAYQRLVLVHGNFPLY